jgi:hypothetical protein
MKAKERNRIIDRFLALIFWLIFILVIISAYFGQ